MTSLRSCTRYPRGGTPPIHIPFFFEAAILSRMRSPMTSRSNCAKDNRTFNVKRPIEVVVLNCCVTETKRRAPGVEDLDDLGKIGERAGQPIDLVDDHDVDPPRGDVGKQLLQSRPLHRRAGAPAVIIPRAQAHPAFVPLAVDKGLAGLALRLQRIERLLEPLFGGFAGIDRASNGSAPPRAVDRRLPHRPAAATEAPARRVSPKNRGPDQWAPVIRSAITVSER